jgi:cell division protease FtsH
MDTVGRKRVFNAFGGSEETNSTLNQLLAEMDGLATVKNNIVVIGATNAAETTLDEALLRPGRFDRKLIIQRPDALEREQIFRFYLSKIKYDGTIDIARIARRAVYKSPADIHNIVQEAALISARDGKPQVDYKDIMNAMDRIELGFKHKLKMSQRELEMTAYHETGHAVVLYYLHPDEEPNYATIIRRGAALGHVQHLPIEELYSKDRDAMMADIKVSIAGYVAERFKYGVTTTGVSADFRHAVNTAHVMVWRLGMGKSNYIGDFASLPEDQVSDEVKHRLNVDTQEILDECIKDVQALLEREKDVFERFAHELIEKEELYYDEIQEIFENHGSRHPRKLRRKPGESVL